MPFRLRYLDPRKSNNLTGTRSVQRTVDIREREGRAVENRSGLQIDLQEFPRFADLVAVEACFGENDMPRSASFQLVPDIAC